MSDLWIPATGKIVNHDQREKDLIWLEVADSISKLSKDPSTKVGCVLVSCDGRLLSAGYNGFPKGVQDNKNRLNSRQLKYKLMVHAEINAIMFKGRSDPYAAYLSSLLPCTTCASALINDGVYRVVAKKQDVPFRWKEDMEVSVRMFAEAGVRLDII